MSRRPIRTQQNIFVTVWEPKESSFMGYKTKGHQQVALAQREGNIYFILAFHSQ
jgi:hypothetical protein